MRRVSCILFLASFITLGSFAENIAPHPTGIITRAAFGSGAKHWQPQSIWEAVPAEKPDLWLLLGDNIHTDTDGTTAWEILEGGPVAMDGGGVHIQVR